MKHLRLQQYKVYLACCLTNYEEKHSEVFLIFARKCHALFTILNVLVQSRFLPFPSPPLSPPSTIMSCYHILTATTAPTKKAAIAIATKIVFLFRPSAAENINSKKFA